jgi:hypothetical protein
MQEAICFAQLLTPLAVVFGGMTPLRYDVTPLNLMLKLNIWKVTS